MKTTSNILRYGKTEMPLSAYASHYPYTVSCRNCFHSENIRIRKGLKVKEIKEKLECENCGCPLELAKF